MTDDKQTGARAAAREIEAAKSRISSICFYEVGGSGFLDNKRIVEARVDAIEAIIVKYCPEDKGVEKLVEACRAALRFQKVIDIDRLPESTRFRAAPLTVKLEAALADYEELNK